MLKLPFPFDRRGQPAVARLWRLLPLLAALFVSAPAEAVSVHPDELALVRQWSAAKFEGVTRQETLQPGLYVLANYDPVQKNSRAGKPMRMGATQYTRGLYCHAFSRIQVRLPSPGKTFTALAGVDSNDQTSGGRGSVEFLVQVGGQEKFRSGTLHEGNQPKPIELSLAGATEFILQISETPDGISCDQADWADAKVTLEDGRELWLADLPLLDRARPPLSTQVPFSFTYGDKPSSELIPASGWTRASRALDAFRTERTLTWTDSVSGLLVRAVAVEYSDFPTVEWTVYFKNTGSRDTPLLTQIQALDSQFERNSSGEFTLHHNKGTFVRPDDFEPLTTVLGPGKAERFAPPAGRPCGAVWPYFNLEWPGEGVILAVGWPGQWAAQFARDSATGCRTVAGQELTRLTLHPGEEIRSPLIVLQFWKGDWQRAQNLWRRWMVAHNLPRPEGGLRPLLPACSSHQFAEMIQANETNQKLFIDRYLEEGLKIDYWWMDAGWYLNQSGWPNTGTWLVDSNRFPNGLRAITDYGRSKGVKGLVWFEPERVTAGTWLATNHPDWLLEGTLLNLGDTNAWTWLVNHIDRTLIEQGIDLYRQDYNIDPLRFWRAHDSPSRQGITENHYVTGYLAYWDELLRRHPGMLIDSCASGGHRNDLETMRRSLPFLRSDCIQDAVGNQGHTFGLSYWLPYHGTGTDQVSTYELRSAMACPHLIACWDLRDRSLDYPHLRRLVNQWRQFADCYFGDYYPLTRYSLGEDVWMAWQFDRPEKGDGIVQAFRRHASPYEVCRFQLRGLEPTARYQVLNLDSPGSSQEFSGADLLKTGLVVTIAERPGTALFTYRKIK